MKILVASDSFKGSLSSKQVGEIVSDELSEYHDVDYIAVSDGGEGFIEAIGGYYDGFERRIPVLDPLGRPIEAGYIISSDNKTAIIESSAACGLPLLQVQERNPLKTSTFGVGQLILDAIENGVEQIYIGLGGSATNDGGAGLLEAVGVTFHERDGKQMTGLCGESLQFIASMDTKRFDSLINDIKILVVSDVDNPLLGPAGATFTYSPQKGADSLMLDILEKGMASFSDLVKRQLGTDHTLEPGSGAAGGLGFCLMSFFNSGILKGIDTVLDLIDFDERIKDLDLLITGEGKIDKQTFRGKAPAGIIKRCRNLDIPVIGICGLNENDGPAYFKKIFSMVPVHATLGNSLRYPEQSLRIMLRKELVPYLKNWKTDK